MPERGPLLDEDDVLIGVLASGKLIDRIPVMEDSWARHWKKENVFYISDFGFSPNHYELQKKIETWPNYYKAIRSDGTKCRAEKADLCCKLEYLYTLWWNDPSYKSKKWFVRVVDDTWIHKNNLLRLLATLNESEAYYIGHSIYWSYKAMDRTDKFGWTRLDPAVNPDIVNYCDGGAGWIISRKVLEVFNTNYNVFQKACRRRIWDDVVFGWFVGLMDLPECQRIDAESFNLLRPNLRKYQTLDSYCKHNHLPVLWHHPNYPNMDINMTVTEQVINNPDFLDACENTLSP